MDSGCSVRVSGLASVLPGLTMDIVGTTDKCWHGKPEFKIKNLTNRIRTFEGMKGN